jgi:sugar phosphate permease
MIAEKWQVFLLTFVSYSLIHSVRTAWSSLKYALNSAPYSFEPIFLGSLDMVVLIILAVSLNLFGPMIEKLGAKTFLQRGILFLAAIVGLIGLLLLAQVSSKLPYSILYPLVGLASCVGWPACIFVPFP